MKPLPKEKAPHLRMSLKTLRGPFNIYPKFFFQENWDNTWIELLKLSPEAFKRENIQMLERSPVAYLELKDKQVLILSRIKDCIENLKTYRLRENLTSTQIEEGERNEDLFKARIQRDLNECSKFFKSNFNESYNYDKENKTFILLGLSYLTFCEALLESGNRSRKTMAVAHSYLLEIKEEGHKHPYFSYYEALLLIGRNKWDEATALLHATLKETQRNQEKSLRPLAKLLCKLYIFLELPHVAQFISKRYLEKPSRNHSHYMKSEWQYKKAA